MWAAWSKLKTANPDAALKKLKKANPDHIALGTAIGLLTTQFGMWCRDNVNKNPIQTQLSNSQSPSCVEVDFGVDGMFVPRKKF